MKNKSKRTKEDLSFLTDGDKFDILQILELIVNDDDLRRGFRNYCSITVPTMRKIMKKLEFQTNGSDIKLETVLR